MKKVLKEYLSNAIETYMLMSGAFFIPVALLLWALRLSPPQQYHRQIHQAWSYYVFPALCLIVVLVLL